MKHFPLTLLVAIVLWLPLSAQVITFPDTAKNNCQLINATGDSITIIFCADAQHFNKNLSTLNKVHVYGSLTAWGKEDARFLLNQTADNCLYRTFPISELLPPGNSGQPEFLFQVYPKSGTAYTLKAKTSGTGAIDKRLMFVNNGENMLLLFPGDDIAEIGRRGDTARQVWTLSKFQPLTDSANVAHLTNFRRVPSTACLYRSYHPFNPDRAKYSTEHERMVQLATLGARYGIRSDIALSGNQTGKAGNKYTCNGSTYTIEIPPYYQSIIANNNVLYVGTENGRTPDYNTAVFRTGDSLFGQWMSETIRFIGDSLHPAPFLIHCSLGADRTGAFCATLAALCGASWSEIAANYHMTSNLMIQEYRHANCVRYELYLLTGEWPEVFAPTSPQTGRTLQQAVAEHFVNGGYLTQDQIDAAVLKLTTPVPPTSLPSVPYSQPAANATKWIYDGQLYISRGAQTFTATGSSL